VFRLFSLLNSKFLVFHSGKFDLIVASNLLCRLPSPKKFLRDIPNFLQPQGLLLLISPYCWLTEHTPKNEWIGGTIEGKTGTIRDSFDALSQLMHNPKNEGNRMVLIHRENIPFLKREHERKFQFGISDCNLWAFA
jgi:SAM-dependent methyltransferase